MHRGPVSRHAFHAFLFLFLSALAAAALPGCAKAAKSYRVGILIGSASMSAVADGFKAKMAELGYVEGRNVSYDIQGSNADRAEEKRIAERFVAARVDLAFAFPGQSALAVKEAAAGTKIPVVFANAVVGGSSLIDSVRSPGGNITGVRVPNPELTVKTFESILELKPGAKRFMVVFDPGYETDWPILEALRLAVLERKAELWETQVPDAMAIREVLEGVDKAGRAGVDAILLLPDTIPRSAEAAGAVLAFADAHGVPLAGGTRAMVERGATLTAAADQGEQGRLAATLADKALKGVPAGTIPVATTATHLIVNYRKARELRLEPPEGLLKQASEIFR